MHIEPSPRWTLIIIVFVVITILKVSNVTFMTFLQINESVHNPLYALAPYFPKLSGPVARCSRLPWTPAVYQFHLVFFLALRFASFTVFILPFSRLLTRIRLSGDAFSQKQTKTGQDSFRCYRPLLPSVGSLDSSFVHPSRSFRPFWRRSRLLLKLNIAAVSAAAGLLGSLFCCYLFLVISGCSSLYWVYWQPVL